MDFDEDQYPPLKEPDLVQVLLNVALPMLGAIVMCAIYAVVFS